VRQEEGLPLNWPFEALEEWWGDRLDFKLAERIAKAPWLLYSHQVAIEDPFNLLSSCVMRDRHDDNSRDELRKIVVFMAELRPLAEMGVVVRTQSWFQSSKRHPAIAQASLLRGDDKAAAMSELASKSKRFVELDSEDRDLLVDAVGYDIGTTLHVLQQEMVLGRCHFLARSEIEQIIHRIFIDRAGAAQIDGRRASMRTLLSLDLPDLYPELDNLIALRRSSDEFHNWRLALATALEQVEQFDEGVEQWNVEARKIVQAELEPMRRELEKSVNKSPALAALKTGATGMMVSGIGATTGFALGGSLTSALASAAASKLAESVLAYVKNIGERRAGRAVLDLALFFDEHR